MSASPPTQYSVAYLDLGRGERWYLLVGTDADSVYRDDLRGGHRGVRGGPFPTRQDAEAEVERRYQEMQDEYDYVEEMARRGGYSVQWGPR